jgi:hypothetical protein
MVVLVTVEFVRAKPLRKKLSPSGVALGCEAKAIWKERSQLERSVGNDQERQLIPYQRALSEIGAMSAAGLLQSKLEHRDLAIHSLAKPRKLA